MRNVAIGCTFHPRLGFLGAATIGLLGFGACRHRLLQPAPSSASVIGNALETAPPCSGTLGRVRSLRSKDEALANMHDMMSGPMTWGMGIGWLPLPILIVLAIAALSKIFIFQ